MMGKLSWRKRVAEYEIVRYHHRLNGYEFKQAQRIVEDRGHAAIHGVKRKRGSD